MIMRIGADWSSGAPRRPWRPAGAGHAGRTDAPNGTADEAPILSHGQGAQTSHVGL
jgi:hypothetical protein